MQNDEGKGLEPNRDKQKNKARDALTTLLWLSYCYFRHKRTAICRIIGSRHITNGHLLDFVIDSQAR